MPFKCLIDEERCLDCDFCLETIFCPVNYEGCVGCLSCLKACPNEARRVVEASGPIRTIWVEVNGISIGVPEGITVKKALELAEVPITKYPKEGGIFAPCEVGGCYACSVFVNGTVVRSCVTPIQEGMRIETTLPAHYTPIRVIHGPAPHTVGGKATPWWLKTVSHYIEVAVWAGGCNLRCPQCQNYSTTYDGRTRPITPREAARRVSEERRFWAVDRMAISGGEPTLNRRWLIEYFKELKRLNPDSDAHLHLDSNGTLLTKDYIDELILDAGVTDIGVEPKGLTIPTFMEITGIRDREVAAKYLETSWNAIRYIIENHRDRVFLGVGLPYNKAFISLDEVRRFGGRLSTIDRDVQLCVLDYFPTFRRRGIERPQPSEMLKLKEILEESGLNAVIVQTSIGHFGPQRAR